MDITFAPSATDAESDMRPPNTTRQIDEHGEVNYYAAADNSILEDRKLLANWKEKLGEALTRDVVKAAVFQQKDTWTGKIENSTIRDFPAGYELFIHRKGDHYSPRIDAYLYGSRHVKCFRSPAEFVNHAKWLMQGSPLKSNDKPDCKCKYCDQSQTQEEISIQLRLRNAPSRDRKRDRDNDGRPRRPRTAHGSGFVPAKDYTKLNPAP